MTLYLYHEEPQPSLRPFLGGADRLVNTRARDFIIGVTKPGPDNTGVLPGSTLTTVIGDIIITTPDTVMENLDIKGRILARAPGLVVRNCLIRGNGADGNLIESLRSDTSALIVDCTIKPDVVGLNTNGIFGGNFTALRCQVSDVVDGFDVLTPTSGGTDPAAATNAQVLGCYFYDFAYISPDPSHAGGGTAGSDNATHNDGIQIHGGAGTVVRGCYFQMTESPKSQVNDGGHPSDGLYGQGVTITPNQSTVTGVVIEDNWLDHGKYGVVGVGYPYPLSVTVRRNRLGPNIITADTTGSGVAARRPVIFPTGADNAVVDFPATTGPDTLAGNVNYDGSPVTIYRENP